MRTTILLPDDLYRQVRLMAAEEARTITSVIEDAVRESLRARASGQDATSRFKVDVITGDGLQPGVDLDDNADLEELMSRDDRG